MHKRISGIEFSSNSKTVVLIAEVENTKPLALRIAWQQGKVKTTPANVPANKNLPVEDSKDNPADDIIPFDQWKMPPQPHGIIKAPTYDLF